MEIRKEGAGFPSQLKIPLNPMTIINICDFNLFITINDSFILK